MATSCLSLDTETYAIRPDLPVPPVVCGSVGVLDPTGGSPTVRGQLLSKQKTLEVFCNALDDENVVIAGANISFDLLVLSAELTRVGIDPMPLLFRALDQGRIYDLRTAEALHAIAEGTLRKDPRTGQQLPGNYSLETCVDLVLGRKDAKANDEWRLRYGELDGIPIDQWPQPARDYPVDDARNTHETVMAQLGVLERVGLHHEYAPIVGDDAPPCVHCGSSDISTPCRVRRPSRNLHAMGREVYAAFALSLGATRGFVVDQRKVDIIERIALRDHERNIHPQIVAGFVREDRTEDRAAIKRAVASAYGAMEPCPICNGTGHVDSSKVKTLTCPDCKGKSAPFKKGGAIVAATVARCARCNSTGRVKHPKQEQVCCFDYDRDENGVPLEDKDGEPIKVKTCDGTGLVLIDDVPRSDKEGVAYSGSALNESGDEKLMLFEEYKADAKILGTYVPFFRTARISDGADGWRDLPLTLHPNTVPLETLRVSYSGSAQQLPRWPGYIDPETGEYVPSLRECITARPGRVLSSEDYTTGELYAHAQSCLWTVQKSDLAKALIAGVDTHAALAATVAGVSYQEFLSWKDDPAKKKRYKELRQASKPANFGFPGGMGATKFVLQQRKADTDTPCEQGPSMIDDGNGGKVPGFRGLRYCILMDNAPTCGIRKTTLWGKRGYEQKIPPTCVHCLECAGRIRASWLRQWSESKAYFDFISSTLDQGHYISVEALDRWPHAKAWFYPGQILAPGEMMQHVSCVVRGGLEYSEACNGLFQQLIAHAAKSALCRVTRECYDRTYRVPVQMYPNSKPTLFGNGPSPLYNTTDPIGFFHDELVCEHDEVVAHEGATRVSEIMVEELAWICPDVADTMQSEPTLMRELSKAAEPRWKNGGKKRKGGDDRLIPWERT